MTLVAQRKFSIGERAFEPGDPVDADAQALLPRGRLEVLKRAGLVEERPGDLVDVLPLIAEELSDLRERVEKLEARHASARKRGGA